MIAALFFIGLILISSALKNTQHELGEQVQRDLLGPQGFIGWALAIIAIGLIGYVPGLQKTSRYLLILLATVCIVRNGGLWANVQTAVEGASTAGPAPSVPSQTVPNPPQAAANSNSSSSGSSGASTALGVLGTVAKIGSLFAL